MSVGSLRLSLNTKCFKMSLLLKTWDSMGRVSGKRELIFVLKFLRWASYMVHLEMTCSRVSVSVLQSLQVGSTVNWLNAALLPCRVYVPVRNLALTFALWRCLSGCF